MKILLFGDAPMAQNEGGINQTLYNLFCFIKPEDFLGITEVDLNKLKKIGSTEPYTSRYRSYRLNFINIRSNKFTKYLSPLIDRFNLFIYKHNSYQKLKTEIHQFNPDVIISCPNTSAGVLMHDKLLNNKAFEGKTIPYFMDDWMYKNRDDRSGNLVNSIIKSILQKNKHWMMISEELGKILAERYQAKAEKILYIRNPVSLSDAPADDNYKKNDPFTIAYAGALWPMHFDSFYAVAKAISSLTNIQLKLYTQQGQWSWRKPELEPLGVIYGGHLPYNQIHQALNQADALLITASFDQENYTHTAASLQTKITDYCKSKRLIISCAPSYSANNNFLKKNLCGVCVESLEKKQIVAQLLAIQSNIYSYQHLVKNAWDTLKDFSQEKVHQKIKDFLHEIA